MRKGQRRYQANRVSNYTYKPRNSFRGQALRGHQHRPGPGGNYSLNLKRKPPVSRQEGRIFSEGATRSNNKLGG